MQNVLILVFIALALLAAILTFLIGIPSSGGGEGYPAYSLTEETRTIRVEAQEIVLHIGQNIQHPHAMDLSIKAQLDGTAVIRWGWDPGEPYRVDTIDQVFELDLPGMDWYNDSCIVQYEPLTAREGQLSVSCGFHGSKKSK